MVYSYREILVGSADHVYTAHCKYSNPPACLLWVHFQRGYTVTARPSEEVAVLSLLRENKVLTF